MPAPTLSVFLKQLHEIASQSPAEKSVPLLIDDCLCGYASEAAASVIESVDPDVFHGDRIRLALSRHLSEQLARIAQALLQAGCIPKWRNELLDVWVGDESVGAVERGAVRPLGLLTRAVHLNGWSKRGDLWVARRALDKPTDPGMWDTLVGGLVGHAESDDLALERETLEEAGLKPSDIASRDPIRSIFRMRRRVAEGFQWEEVLTSDCILEDGIEPQNQDGEVMEIACLPVHEIERMLLDNQFTVEAGIVIAQSLLERQPD